MTLSDGTDLTFKFVDGRIQKWRFASGSHSGTSGTDWYEAIDIAQDVVFIEHYFNLGRAKP